MTGKTLSAISVNLSGGLQAFEIRGLGTGIYLLKVTTETRVHQERLITHSQTHGKPQINYLGSFDHGLVALKMKSTKNIGVMQYNDGERLLIKGISGDYSHTKSLIPNESQNIDFEFIECVDGDGNHYGVVTIGEQVWMAENLKTTKYRDGVPIEYPGTDNDAWANMTIGAYAWYDNDISWKDSYGALYNWHATNNATGLCPTGWHAPSNDEWTQLVDYAVAQGFPNVWDNPNGAGNALKSCRQVNSPLGGDCNTTDHPRFDFDDTHGFDEFGFSSFPGGCRHSSGTFYWLGMFPIWWSSTVFVPGFAWRWNVGGGGVGSVASMKTHGFSVRCLRD
jgi:uncharacterized protein (TIGR02145 family)